MAGKMLVLGMIAAALVCRRSGSGDANSVAWLIEAGKKRHFLKLRYFLNRQLKFAAVQLRHCLTCHPYLPSSPARRAGLFASTNETNSTGALCSGSEL